MSPRKKAANKPKSRPKLQPAETAPPVASVSETSPRQDREKDPLHSLNDCVSAASLVEVTINSLEQREIGHPEQETLKQALNRIWAVYDWIDRLDYPDSTESDGKHAAVIGDTARVEQDGRLGESQP